jgi:molecular chaperone HtpG
MKTKETDVGKQLLETLTDALYSEPVVIFREYVQNAVDSFIANDIKKAKGNNKVNIDINRKTESIKIKDNGEAVPFAKFQDTMVSISKSGKDESQIGFRGIGRLSGMPFCEELIFRNKHTDSDKVQICKIEGVKYKKILNDENNHDNFEKVMLDITEFSQLDSMEDSFFEVELKKIGNELINCIFQKQCKHGHSDIEMESSNIPTEYFLSKLSNLLPLPYKPDFTYRDKIHENYKKIFPDDDLKNYEFVIILNGEQLYKGYTNKDILADMFFIPFNLKNKKNAEINIGFVWLTFSYVFKSIGSSYGINVRSKNMLLRGDSVLADEASLSPLATTTRSQYLNALVCVEGEFLIKVLDRNILSDNSKRDWFKTNEYSLQLRDKICVFLSSMNKYRYEASRYKNKYDDNAKAKMHKALNNFVINPDLSIANNYFDDLHSRMLKDEKRQQKNRNDVADVLDIPEHNNVQKRFYVKLMHIIYDFYKERGEKGIYYFLKKYIQDKLNKL